MNGPTRPTAFDRPASVRGAREADAPRAPDVFDELDQFVDSEPVGWAAPPGGRSGRPLPQGPPVAPQAHQGPQAPDLDLQHDLGPDREPESDFDVDSDFDTSSLRLRKDEVAAPPSFPSWPEERDEEHRARGDGLALGETAAPPAEAARLFAPDDTDPVEARIDAAFSQKSASPRRDAFARRLDAELARSGGEAAAPTERAEARRAAAGPAGRSAGEDESPAARAGDAAAVLAEAFDPDAVEAEPADALEWELDNAIGAIVASGQARRQGGEPDADVPVQPATEAEAEPRDDASAAMADDPAPPPPHAPREEQAGPTGNGPAVRRPPRSLATPVNPAAGLGSARMRPPPTFRFERRAEEGEPFPPAPPDLDDPLSGALFPHARPAPAGARDVAEADDFERPFEPDLEEELELPRVRPFEEDEEAELPPSLRRAVRAASGGRFGSRRRGLLTAAAGTALLAVIAVVGVNVFAKPGGPVEAPPVIRADARDVKVRVEEEEATARPDLAERAALGESDRLVMPDRVRLGATTAIELQDEAPQEELASRQVRTVVVRPDGSLVPVADGGPTAAPRGKAAAATDASIPSDTARTAAGGEVAALAPASPSAPASFPAGASWTSFEPARTPAGATGLDAATDEPAEEGPAAAVPAGPAPGDESLANAGAAAGPVARPRPRPAVPVASGGPLALSARPGPSTAPVGAAGAVTQAAVSAPWAVQISSQRTRAEAQASLRALQQRYRDILGDFEPVIVEADVGDRGHFFRVRVPAASRGEAAALCQRLKSAGGDCFIGRS